MQIIKKFLKVIWNKHSFYLQTFTLCYVKCSPVETVEYKDVFLFKYPVYFHENFERLHNTIETRF